MTKFTTAAPAKMALSLIRLLTATLRWRDALNSFPGRVIEVHLSNIHQREAFRHLSYVSARADGVIAGLGVQGYVAALDALAQPTPMSG